MWQRAELTKSVRMVCWWKTAAELPEDAYLQIRFAVPKNDQLEHYEPFGRVVSCSIHGVGLLLDVLEPAARDALQALLGYGTRLTS